LHSGELNKLLINNHGGKLMKSKRLLLFALSIFIVAAVLFNIRMKKDIDKKVTDPDAYSLETEKSENPVARAQWELNMLKNPATGKIPNNIRNRELEFAKTMSNVGKNSLGKTTDLTFASRGPVNRGGRTRALAVDVKSTAGNVTLIAGGITGGIWKSIDDGANWSQKITGSQLHNASCIAQDTKTGSESTWYVGTGESFGNSANGEGGASFLGNGIFKSIDNGDSWTLLTNTAANSPQQFTSAFQYVYNIAVSPATGTVVAAASATLQRSAGTDGGNNWTLVKGALSNSQASDVIVDKNGIFYASISSGNTDEGLWKSTDDGATWTSITPAGFPGTYTRIVIAVGNSDPNRLYILANTPGSGNVGPAPENDENMIWKSTDGGTNWVDKTSNMPASSANVAGYTSQGAYDMVIKVKPDDANFVVFGGTNLYRSTDGMETKVLNTAVNWIGGYAITDDVNGYTNHHPDNHSFAFSGVDNKISYSGHDGGVSRSADITANPNVWTDISIGYITSQFYSVAINPTTASDPIIIGGLQDNGNYYTNSTSGTVNWVELPFGGDGGFTAVASDKSSYLIETQNGGINRLILDANGNTTDFATLQPSGATGFTFINPFALDPNGKILYMPIGNTIWRNSDITGVPTGSQNKTSVNWTNMTNTDKGSATSAVGISTTPADRLYYGTSDGKVYRVDGANTGDPSATDVWTGKGFPVSAYVYCIAVDPTNADNAMLVFSNYEVKSIFYTSDGGTTWSNVSGTLEQNPDGTGNGPSVRWASIAKVGGNYTYYAATSTGLYSTNSLTGTVTWTQIGANTIGNVVCSMVLTRNSDGVIVVATHANGVYSSTITTEIENDNVVTPSSYLLSQNYPNPFNPSTKIKFAIPTTGNVKIIVYDNLGREVTKLLDSNLAAGQYTENFDASKLASGVYFYRLSSGSFVQTKKMILIR
jgi:hypothetical protein